MKKDRRRASAENLKILAEIIKEKFVQKTESPLPYEISKVADYTYQMYCDTLDYDNAIKWFEETDEELTGACSSVRIGNFYGRNYDWTYDDTADFVIKTPSRNGRYATIGFGGVLGDLTADFVESGAYSPLYKVIPFKIVDGINEKGVVCNINVVPKISDITHTTPNIDTEDTLCNRMLPRFVLDNFATAKEAAEYIRDHVSVYNHKELREGHNYDLHMMIADKDNTYLLEFMEETAEGETVLRTVIKEMHDKAFMTNFHLSNVTFNEDGSVYTPYDKSEDTTHDPMTANNIHKFGAGLERYNIINSVYNSIEEKSDIANLVYQSIKYTNTYGNPSTTQDADKWYSEGVGDYGESGEVTVSSDKSTFDYVYGEMYNLYTDRDRETAKTWQTVHSCVYDIENRSVDVRFQEEVVTFQFEVEYVKQVQSDWNQNDKTKADYIKNRTHWVDYTPTVYEPVTTTFTEASPNAKTSLYGYNQYPEGFLDNIAEGNTIYANIDGIEIGGILHTSNSTYWAGNGYMFQQSLPNTCEDWCIATASRGFDSIHIIVPASYIGEHDVVTSLGLPNIHKIDGKFLHQADWNQNDDTKVDYIKNRTHYVISETETSVIIEDKNIAGDVNQNLIPDTDDLYDTTFYVNEMFILEENKKYRITLKYTDETSREVITLIDKKILEPSYNDVYDDSLEIVVSNHLALLLRDGESISDDQILLYNNNDNAFVVSFINIDDKKYWAYGNQPYYLTVEEVISEEVVKKIDKKFLPEMSSIKHLVDGSSDGSLKSSNSVTEDGDYTIGENAVALGKDTMAIGESSFAEGNGCDYGYPISFEKVENGYIVDTEWFAVEEGVFIRYENEIYTISSVNVNPDDDYSLIVEFEEGGPDDSFEGYLQGYASGARSHVEGNCTTAIGDYGAHAEGDCTVASGSSSHAEGFGTISSGNYSHAECDYTTASGSDSHAEGYYTTASGSQSHAEGDTTVASGSSSHTEGYNTTANHKSQHVFGEFNIEDDSTNPSSLRGNYIEIVGNGTGSSAKSNARTLDWDGNEHLAGKLTVGNTQGTLNGLFGADSSKAGKIPYINTEGNVVLTNRYESAAGLTANEVSVHDHRTEFADTTKYTPLMRFKHRNDMNKFQIEFSVSTIDSTGGNLATYYARYIFYRSTIFGMYANEGKLMCIDFNTSDQSLFNYTDIVAVSEVIDGKYYTVFYKKNYHEYDYSSYCIHSMSTYSFDGLSGYVVPTYYVGKLATNLKDGEVEITTSDLKSYSDFTTVFPCTPMNVNDGGNSILRKLYAGPIPTQSSITGNVTYTLADISKMMSVKLTGATTTITLPEPTDMTLDFKISVQQDATGGRNLVFTAPTANVYDINNSNFAAGTANQKCLVALSWDGTDWWMSASDYFNA